jgi:SPP1 family predicted phage head-tail adaptor
MRAGRLTKRVTFQERSTTLVGAGDQSETWSNSFNDWVALEPLSGRELIAGASVQNVSTHRVTMRYRDDVNARMRIKYGDRYFNITSPPRNTDERNRELVFEAQEGLVDG